MVPTKGAIPKKGGYLKKCVVLLERISIKASPKELLVHGKERYVLPEKVTAKTVKNPKSIGYETENKQ